MLPYRSYQIDALIQEKTTTFHFEEHSGGVLPAEVPSEKSIIAEWNIRDEISEGGLRLTIRGWTEEERPFPAKTDIIYRLSRLFTGLLQIKAGAAPYALERLHFFRYSEDWEMQAAAKYLSAPERCALLPTALLDPWKQPEVSEISSLAFLAGVDPQAVQADISAYLRRTLSELRCWSARIVGFKFQAEHFLKNEMGIEKSKVHRGDVVYLAREHHNKEDPDAVAVIHGNGLRLGHLRRSLAQYIAPMIDKGAVFTARVTAFLPQEYSLDERIQLMVERV